MIHDHVMKFFQDVRTDEAAVARLRAQGGDPDTFARLAADLGRERGFAFEPSEVREALDAIGAKAEGGLSEQELSAVAGGGGFTTACYLGMGGGASAGCTGATMNNVYQHVYQWMWVNTQWVYRQV
jgi:hypothetical protein